MAIDSTGATKVDLKDYQYQGGSKPTAEGGDLGKDAFLKLLVTQLRYQDPLEPMDNSAFISQMAQFSSLEQMQNMSTSFTGMQATTMLGKNVYAEIKSDDLLSTYEISGVVKSTVTEAGKTKLVVDGIKVDEKGASRVTGVAIDIADVSQMSQTGTAEAGDVWQLSNLLGKSVSAVITDPKDSSKTIVVSGEVTGIKKINNIATLTVGSYTVLPSEILEIL